MRIGFSASGDQAGTAPGDRRFRPDVEGLRAVAVALVVLYHANVPLITGGFVGVDVFFVISGFVIAGLLLQRSATGRTSLLGFYARRARRIIPAAALVIVITVLLSYHFLGYVDGNSAAVDGRWAAVFLSNFHFEATGTNYLSSFLPPSPLQNFWSLSVEEQFYAVFPLLLLVVAKINGRLSLRVRFDAVLSVIVVASFTLSVVQTSASPTVAFLLAVHQGMGAGTRRGLIALGTERLLRVPRAVSAVASWLGLAMILIATFTLSAQSSYPGYLVALPVLGAGLIIAGGTAAPQRGVEALLALTPFRLLGKVSYSFYLWHWPILIIAAESAGLTYLPAPRSLLWVALALAVSIGSYLLVENPIRHNGSLTRAPWASVGVGVLVTLVALVILSVELGSHGTPKAHRQDDSSGLLATPDAVRQARCRLEHHRKGSSRSHSLTGCSIF